MQLSVATCSALALLAVLLAAPSAAQLSREEQAVFDALAKKAAAGAARAARSSTQGAKIQTLKGDVVFHVEDGKKVGYKVGDESIVYFNDLPEVWQDDATNRDTGILEAMAMGYKLGQSSPTASGMIDFVNKTQAEKYAEFDAKIAEQQKAAGEIVPKALKEVSVCTGAGKGLVGGKCVALPWVVANGAPKATCGKDNVGGLRHDDKGALMMCGSDGKWGNVSPPTVGKSSATPGKSCADIKRDKFDTGSGKYWVGEVGKARVVYCDMGGDGKATGDGSTKDTPALSCLSIFNQYGSVTPTVAKFWIAYGKSVVQATCALRPFFNDVVMAGDGKVAYFGAPTCQAILTSFGLKNGDKRWVDGILVTCDVSKDGKTAKKKQTSGLTSGDPADSCKAIKAGGGTKDGEYYVKSENGILKVYCDLTTNGGGWTMVVKVSNHDAGNFYCKGSNGPLQRGVDINTNEQSTLKKVDMMAKAYRFIKHTDMMIWDMNSKEWVSSTFSGSTPLWNRIRASGGSNAGGAFSCSTRGTNFKKKGGRVGGIRPSWLGIKCEDDGQRSWRCDDDAVFIGWGQEWNGSHRNGIAKCGCDGGSDIYAGENRQTPGVVAVFVR